MVTERSMSYPVRMPSGTTCGVILPASGTWMVSKARPVPECPVGSPGMNLGPTTIGKDSSYLPSSYPTVAT